MAENTYPARAGRSSLLGVLFRALSSRIRGQRQHDFDSLTGVLNREYIFNSWLPIASRRQKRSVGWLTVGFVDFDNLKGMNTNLGHPETDQCIRHGIIALDEAVYHSCPAGHKAGFQHHCLRQVKCPERATGSENAGENHRHRLHPCHAVARTGGDEFMISFFSKSAKEAQAVADVIAGQVSNLRHQTEFDYPVQMGMSVGIAWNPEWSYMQLVNAADQAMYCAKRKRGKNLSWNLAVMHDRNMEEERRIANASIQARRNAVNNPALRQVFVPLITDVYDKTAGAVMRTLPRDSYHPDMGPLPEDDIGHYGRVGIDSVGLAVDILKSRPELPALFVPVSMDLIRSRDFDDLLAVLASCSHKELCRIYLCLHGLQMKFDDLLTHQRLSVLRAHLGGLAVDGFGGHGGTLELQVISAFPEITTVMLHPSLIEEATRTKRGQVLLEHIIQICENLGMTPVITGVDTRARAQLFAELSHKIFPHDHAGDAESWRRRRMFTGSAAGFLVKYGENKQRLAG